MNGIKDYYLLLGVYPNAHLDSISASYHRLLTNYNKKLFDKSYSNTQLKNQTNNYSKIAELDEAYSIVSNPNKRLEFNHTQGNKNLLAKNYLDKNFNIDPDNQSASDNEWISAAKKFPDLLKLDKELNSISWCLSHLFKSNLLEQKDYFSKRKLAKQLESEFLVNFFSDNNLLMNFAKMLIINKELISANQLNLAIMFSEEKMSACCIIENIIYKYPIDKLLLNSLFIQAAMELEPDIVKIYLKAGAHVNVLVDGNQSLFNYFTSNYGFMRYRGNEKIIARRYEIERIFYKYGAKKIDIIRDNKQRLLDKKIKRKQVLKLFIIIALFMCWLAYIN